MEKSRIPMDRHTGAKPSRRRADERGLLAELAAIYRDADAAYGLWSCPASTDCCRFGVTGREPYVTSIELAAIRRASAQVASSSDANARSRRALPVVDTERRCPFLSDAGRCRIYDARPLGCRTFWCERADRGEPVRHERVRELVRRIRELAARHERGGDEGRPLTRALDCASAR